MNIPYVMKRCTKCGRWLVASTVNFHKSKVGKYGLISICKECINNKDNLVNTDPSITKVCSECGREFPATLEYFHKGKRSKYGLRATCKFCITEKIFEENDDYAVNTDPSITKVCTICGREFPATVEYFHKTKHGKYGLQSKCKECRNKYSKRWRKANPEQQKQYRENNKEKIAKHNKQWRENNKEKIAEKNKRYYENNKEKEAERHKQYYQTPQGKVVLFNSHQRRRIKEEEQGTGITKEQWLEMMSFFNWKCAYSGEKLTKDNRSVDHIVPLNSGGNNMIWNMVPMTRSLNTSKHAKNMLEWYREQDFYDPKRLQKIYKWQEYAYNKWGKDTEYFNTNDIQITLL